MGDAFVKILIGMVVALLLALGIYVFSKEHLIEKIKEKIKEYKILKQCKKCTAKIEQIIKEGKTIDLDVFDEDEQYVTEIIVQYSGNLASDIVPGTELKLELNN